MAKKQGKKAVAPSKLAKQPIQTRRWAKWLVPILLVLFITGIILSVLPPAKRAPIGPQFQKEGTLQFKSAAGQVIKQIDIEIADEEWSRQQGLMWRKSMEDNQGMLFIMDKLEPQAFWMLNTYIPLDIIFLDDQLQIIKIRANTQPQSLDQVASEKPALYVVEVNAGFAQQHGIREGDIIQFAVDSRQ